MDFQHILNTMPDDLQKILLEELFQNPFMGINITDGEGRVLFLNQAHRRITGHAPELYLGRSMQEIAEEGLISQSATMITLQTKQPTDIQQITSQKHHYFQVKAIPVMDQQQKIQYVINYLLDVSDMVKLRNQLEEISIQNNELLTNYELLRKELNASGELIYASQAMQHVVEAAFKVAGHDVSVLIIGPSGAGKELIANLIHTHSKRSNGPFIKINCAAIPEHLLESELFGYEAGAFTGGNPKGKKGLFEEAQNGTLLLDEIGELPLALQSKLLRVLQSRKLRHLGGNQDIDIDFRLIASTNANLKEMITKKVFREDLYYRLNVIELHIPPLEERQEDIIPLVHFFLKKYNKKYEVKKTLDQEAMCFLAACHYAGNVRELKNVVERTVIMSGSDVITLSDVQAAFGCTAPAKVLHVKELPTQTSLKALMAEYEKKVLTEYIKQYKSASAVSRVLKTDQSTISRKLHRYQIE